MLSASRERQQQQTAQTQCQIRAQRPRPNVCLWGSIASTVQHGADPSAHRRAAPCPPPPRRREFVVDVALAVASPQSPRRPSLPREHIQPVRTCVRDVAPPAPAPPRVAQCLFQPHCATHATAWQWHLQQPALGVWVRRQLPMPWVLVPQ